VSVTGLRQARYWRWPPVADQVTDWCFDDLLSTRVTFRYQIDMRIRFDIPRSQLLTNRPQVPHLIRHRALGRTHNSATPHWNRHSVVTGEKQVCGCKRCRLITNGQNQRRRVCFVEFVRWRHQSRVRQRCLVEFARAATPGAKSAVSDCIVLRQWLHWLGTATYIF